MREQSVEDYLRTLASGDATPGGGSAAAVAGAMGAALLSMVANFTLGREKYAAFATTAAATKAEAETLREELLTLAERDAEAYGGYAAAVALPKGTDEEKGARRAALQAATVASAEVPLATARACVRVLELAVGLAEECNPYLVSDVAVAAETAGAGLRSATVNVRVNLKSLDGGDFRERAEEEILALSAAGGAAETEARRRATKVMGLG